MPVISAVFLAPLVLLLSTAFFFMEPLGGAWVQRFELDQGTNFTEATM
jgi:hypothetical protein